MHEMKNMNTYEDNKSDSDNVSSVSKSKSKPKEDSKSEFVAPHKPKNSPMKSNKNSDEEIKLPNSNKRSSDSSDDAGSSNTKEEFEKKRSLEDKLAQKTHYYLMNIFIQGSTLHGFLWIDSYINPRHVRGTIFFTYIVLIWYVCAVAYNNMREPDEIPDFDREASDLTWGEIWMAYAAPWGATILLYIFTIILKISPERIRATRTTKFLDYVISEYKREMVLRYLMGYFILAAVHFMVFLYIIQFTAIHGWKIAWRWWYTGSLSFFINIFIYDPLIAAAHWGIYK